MILISVMVCDQEQAPVEGTNVTNASHSSASDVPVEIEMKVKKHIQYFNIEMPSIPHISMNDLVLVKTKPYLYVFVVCI